MKSIPRPTSESRAGRCSYGPRTVSLSCTAVFEDGMTPYATTLAEYAYPVFNFNLSLYVIFANNAYIKRMKKCCSADDGERWPDDCGSSSFVSEGTCFTGTSKPSKGDGGRRPNRRGRDVVDAAKALACRDVLTPRDGVGSHVGRNEVASKPT
ncbi:hypothetical protein EVAR_82464_1 [Eumeta japonica]|uniref:Uncharacterized protein n=1 Tax=Eumeta variegata TaxID=151549 RepID=A0A4C1X8C8_EUMVA|nr:hypothetical protein EVAR_82464_1 [Eumeta japonica]